MPRLNSSALRSVTYDGESSILFVTFETGRLYAYRGVPAEVFTALTTAPSAGRAFNDLVRDRYPFTDITDEI